MKTKTMIARIALVMALAAPAVGCNHEEQDRQAIVKALHSRMEARDRNAGFVRQVALPRFLRLLKQIDVSDCPNEFQTAWLAYVQAWERYATPSPIERRQRQVLEKPTSVTLGVNLEHHVGLGSGIGAGGGVQYESKHENYGKLVEFFDREDTSEAWRAVESVALKFKVDALKYE
jgi:hypothetical protein